MLVCVISHWLSTIYNFTNKFWQIWQLNYKINVLTNFTITSTSSTIKYNILIFSTIIYFYSQVFRMNKIENINRWKNPGFLVVSRQSETNQVQCTKPNNPKHIAKVSYTFSLIYQRKYIIVFLPSKHLYWTNISYKMLIIWQFCCYFHLVDWWYFVLHKIGYDITKQNLVYFARVEIKETNTNQKT